MSLDAHVRDLERLRQELGQKRLHLAGHSMGTYLALSYLEEYPDRTGGLALLAAVSPVGFDFVKDSAARRRMRRKRKEFFEWPACDEELREEGVNRPDSLLSDKEQSAKWRIRFTCGNAYHVERWRAMEGGMALFDRGANEATGRSMTGLDVTAELQAHPCPVRVMIGDHDWIVGGPYAAKWYQKIPEAEVRLLENTGHQLWLDAPEEFSRSLRLALEDATQCSSRQVSSLSTKGG